MTQEELEAIIDIALSEFLYGEEARKNDEFDSRGHISMNYYEDLVKYIAKQIKEADGAGHLPVSRDKPNHGGLIKSTRWL